MWYIFPPSPKTFLGLGLGHFVKGAYGPVLQKDPLQSTGQDCKDFVQYTGVVLQNHYMDW